jgi:hypothetical protein
MQRRKPMGTLEETILAVLLQEGPYVTHTILTEKVKLDFPDITEKEIQDALQRLTIDGKVASVRYSYSLA